MGKDATMVADLPAVLGEAHEEAWQLRLLCPELLIAGCFTALVHKIPLLFLLTVGYFDRRGDVQTGVTEENLGSLLNCRVKDQEVTPAMFICLSPEAYKVWGQ